MQTLAAKVARAGGAILQRYSALDANFTWPDLRDAIYEGIAESRDYREDFLDALPTEQSRQTADACFIMALNALLGICRFLSVWSFM